ncbi:hypothetical protein [Bradyrhizobium tunisiense]|uniref:hypothetical protein n=1 Tax=Bradyrhizobium tunisiense TaxID=3278709 RepID=UPI0035E182CF
MPDKEPFEVADASGLTDADWADINKLRKVYAEGGSKALNNALRDLGADPVRYVRVMGALFPDDVREAIKDEMANRGITEEDLQELVRKLESPARDQ